MSSDVMRALGKRAAQSRKWRWMPGMKAIGRWPGYPVRLYDFGENLYDTDDIAEDPEYLRWQQTHVHGGGGYEGPYYPDLSDPATLGCLLALVREAWGMPTGIIVRHNDNTQRWFVSWAGATHGGECGSGDTEAEALVTALENAP